MTQEYYTEDMGDIMSSSLEREEVRKILNAWCDNGLPEDFYGQGVKFALNKRSGNTFLINDDYQCAMMHGDSLESFYSTPYKGIEGFWGDLVAEYPTMCEEDQEYMRDIADGRELPDIEGDA